MDGEVLGKDAAAAAGGLLGLKTARVLRRAARVALALTTLSVTLSLAHAEAAEYTVWSCRGPDGAALPATAWVFDSFDAIPGELTFSDDCATGGALSISLSPSAPTLLRKPRGTARFELPRGTRIVEYELSRFFRAALLGVGTYAAGVRERSASVDLESGCSSVLALPLYACGSVGDPVDPDGPGNIRNSTGLDLLGLELWAACLSTGCSPGLIPPDAELKLYRSSVVIEDSMAPSPPQLSGTLTEPGPVPRLATLLVEGADDGGGVAAVSLAIDGGAPQVIAPAGSSSSCQEPYFLPRPCPAEVARLFTVDTSSLVGGIHTATGTVVDPAGNVTPFGPLLFMAAHHGSPGGSAGTPPPTPVPEVGNGDPAVKEPRLRLEARRLEHARGRAAILRGRLTTETGTPISGAKLGVEEVAYPTELTRRLAPVTTSATGGFEVRLPGHGARKVTVSFAPSADGRPTRQASATVRTRATLQLARRPARIKRRGTVEFRGRLAGAGAAARGAVVEMQAVVSGRWRAVATVKVRPNGAFRWPYRFRYVERDARFSFRAVLRHTPGWPWSTLRSRRLPVTIDGG